MPIQSPTELLAYQLKQIQDAESQASQAIQEMSGQAQNNQLKQLLERRMKEGERIQQDVQKVMQKLDGSGGKAQNAAARGIIEEARKLVGEVGTPEMKQAVMIGGAQALEHYCIAVWGTVKAMAQECGEQDLAQAMERAIGEGSRWDQEMTKIAESRVNPQAIEQEQSGGGQQGGGQSGGQQSQSGSQSGGGQSGGGQQSQGSSGGGQGSSSGDDLKSREYRGSDGQIHHHTKDYMERKGE